MAFGYLQKPACGTLTQKKPTRFCKKRQTCRILHKKKKRGLPYVMQWKRPIEYWVLKAKSTI